MGTMILSECFDLKAFVQIAIAFYQANSCVEVKHYAAHSFAGLLNSALRTSHFVNVMMKSDNRLMIFGD